MSTAGLLGKLLHSLDARVPEDPLVTQARRVTGQLRRVEVSWAPRALWWQHEFHAVSELEALLEVPFGWLTRRPAMLRAFTRAHALLWKTEVALHEAGHGAAGLLAGFEPALSWTTARRSYPGGVARPTRHPGPSATLRWTWKGQERRVVVNGGELGLDLPERLVAFGLAPRLLALPGGTPLSLSAHDERQVEQYLRSAARGESPEAVVSRIEGRLREHPDFKSGAHALARALIESWPNGLSATETRAVFTAACEERRGHSA
ncbi:hypothetical protein [Deinococcus peraridilitoris]|uniref:Uncharacterized protein n=1 Tax=Deinococcus peraridilitoris (strain DSM 19664 / LMG 22246 / CIP 109416 / KR-200) TaxID=937777 RepID=K9ZZB2_DEIPD|nr:hypothetical protein [Deinococcus peraridilitoris]AFZ66936.1 hypothetical protein Deipe_1394 [Deinococcus peraridilitoris DSM 19664]